MRRVVCRRCGREYLDEESIRWVAEIISRYREGPACPYPSCRGELVVVEK